MFNIGDKVVAIAGQEGMWLKAGEVYTVTKYHEDEDYVFLRKPDGELVENGFDGGVYIATFRIELYVDQRIVAVPNAQFNWGAIANGELAQQIAAAPIHKYLDANCKEVKVGDRLCLADIPDGKWVYVVKELCGDGKIGVAVVDDPNHVFGEFKPSMFIKHDWEGFEPGKFLESTYSYWYIKESYPDRKRIKGVALGRNDEGELTGNGREAGYETETAAFGMKSIDPLFMSNDAFNYAMDREFIKGAKAIMPAAKAAPKIDVAKLKGDIKKRIAEYSETFQKKYIEPKGKIKDIGCADFYVLNYDPKTGVLYDKGGLAQACHYDLNRIGYDNLPKNSVPAAVIDNISRINTLTGLKTAAKKYAQYVMKESPWKAAYKRQSFANAFKNGCDMNLKVTGNQLAAACIAMRHSTERPEQMASFGKLKEMGMSGNAAWLASYWIGYDKNGWTQHDFSDGHCVMHKGARANDVFSFFANGFKDKGEESYIKEQNYDNVYGEISDTWHYRDNEKAGSISLWMKERIKAKQIGGGFAVKFEVVEEDVISLCQAIDKAITESIAK